MKCPSCGMQNEAGAVQCVKCGASLNTASFAASGPAPSRVRGGITVKDLLLGRAGTTDASVISSGLIGLLLTVIFYVAFPLPLLKGTYVYDIFTKRGNIQYAISLLFFWALTILVLKLIKLIDQQRAFKLNIIPPGVTGIKPKDAQQLIANFQALDRSPRDKILINRVWTALEHYRSLGKVEKVDEILQYQGQIDMDIMESSYTVFKVFIWAIPILGFIGTVLGIGRAVGGFSDFTKVALEIDQIKTALDVITAGLSVAFDTTLLGLVCAVILMLPGTGLQKMEENFLVAVETYCLDNLLNRFKAVDSVADTSIDEESLAYRFKEIIEQTFEDYLAKLQDCFKSWSDGFGTVMEGVTGQSRLVGEQFAAIKPIAEGFKSSVAEFTGQLKGVAGQQTEVLQRVSSQLENVQPLVSGLGDIRNSMEQERKGFLEQAENWLKTLEKSGNAIVDRMAAQQQQQLSGLNEVRSAMEQGGSAIIDKMAAQHQQQLSGLNDLRQQQMAGLNELRSALEQERRNFQEQAGAWLRNLDRVGGDLLSKIADQQQQALSGQSKELQEVLQTFQSLVSKEGEIVSLINKNYEQMTASDRMFKETLSGIRAHLEGLRPSLEQLAKPKKVRLIEE